MSHCSSTGKASHLKPYHGGDLSALHAPTVSVNHLLYGLSLEGRWDWFQPPPGTLDQSITRLTQRDSQSVSHLKGTQSHQLTVTRQHVLGLWGGGTQRAHTGRTRKLHTERLLCGSKARTFLLSPHPECHILQIIVPCKLHVVLQVLQGYRCTCVGVWGVSK